MSEFPNLRLFVVRVMSLFESIFYNINYVFPNKLCQKFIHFTGHGEVVAPFLPKRSTVVRVDWNGNILGSLHGFDKSVGHVSHVLEMGEHLYLGSPYNRFLARVRSPKSPQVKIRNVRYEGLNMDPVVELGNVNKKEELKVTKPTTPKPKAQPSTTTVRPTTTTRATTTTQKPTARPTTTAKPETATIKSPQDQKTTSTTTAKPPTPTKPKQTPKDPAPVEENREDIKPPPQEKLKIIKKGGKHTEL